VARNVAAVREVVGGAAGPLRDVVVVNAAAALVAADRYASIDEGIAAAQESISSGGAARVLERVIVLSAAG